MIEILISIAIIGGAIAVFATLFNVLKVNKTGNLYTAAYKLAQEELEAVRALPLSDLTVRANSDFINVLYNNGSAGEEVGALRLTAPTSSIGIVVLPSNKVADLTLEANVKSSSLTNENGLLFRVRDLENYYFFYFTESQIKLVKNVGGTETELYGVPQSFTAGTYYKLKIITSGTSISIYLNDNLLQTVSDDSHASGYSALASNNTVADFDDVTFLSDFWDFNSLGAGEMPSGWQKLGISDLPDGSGKITISEPYGSSGIKQIDVTVSWIERGEAKTVTLSTLRTE